MYFIIFNVKNKNKEKHKEMYPILLIITSFESESVPDFAKTEFANTIIFLLEYSWKRMEQFRGFLFLFQRIQTG